MKLYTKRGDDGTTGLLGGSRLAKSDPRVAAYGEVDEINAAIGVVLATCQDEEAAGMLRGIQSDLFVLGSELATGIDKTPAVAIQEAQVTQLERWIDKITAETKPLKQFILPGGTQTAAGLHFARTICRRAERTTVALAAGEPLGRWTLAYLNRLGDLLFALARWANKREGRADIPWVAPKESD